MRAATIAIAIPLLLLGLSSCKSSKPPPYRGEGRLIAEGPAREVLAAPGGKAIAWLASPAQAKERGIHAPDHIYIGRATFWAGQGPVVLGDGVTTVPGSFFFSPSGRHLGALTGWSFDKQEGTLVVGSVEKNEARTVAKNVSFFAFSQDGQRLGYVSDGVLHIEPSDGGEAVRIGEDVSTFEFSPDGTKVLAKKSILAGGQLLLAEVDGQAPARPLAQRVSEYKWSPNGDRIAFTARSETGGSDLFVTGLEGRPARKGEGVATFQFSREGKHLAFIGDISVQKQFGDLFVIAKGKEEAEKIGKTVTDFSFSHDERRIAWLDEYNAQSRGGHLTWREVASEGEPVKMAPDVPSFIWSKDGENLAFIRRIHEPIFSVDLFLGRLGKEEPEIFSIAKGVFGYSFSGDSKRLFLRTECVRNGRSCELYSVEVREPAETIKKIAGGIHTYEPDWRDESVFMITYARMESQTFDLGVVPTDGSTQVHMLDRMALPGTRLLVGDEVRIAYAVLEGGRQGVYIADVPDFRQAIAAP